MAKTKSKPTDPPKIEKMPKGYYVKDGYWYKRIHKPNAKSGRWELLPEATRCRENQKQEALDYIKRRVEELQKTYRLRLKTDPGKVTVNSLLDDYLASLANEHTRRVNSYNIDAHLRPFFGEMLAVDVTVQHCRAFRIEKRKVKVRDGFMQDTTINRYLGYLSKAFTVGMTLGKIHSHVPGGCDFLKKAEQSNTRRVRLSEKYYHIFKDALHPALKNVFVVGYEIGRRKAEVLGITWDKVDFEERCVYFDETKEGAAGKAPFFGEMEQAFREQWELRDQYKLDSAYVFFWFEMRGKQAGERIKRFDGSWKRAVDVLKSEQIKRNEQPTVITFHDTRRSAHHKMRKAGIDPKTRMFIMGHKTGSMDQRYTMVGDEDFAQAVEKMNVHQKRNGLADAVRSLSDDEWNQLVAARMVSSSASSSANGAKTG